MRGTLVFAAVVVMIAAFVAKLPIRPPAGVQRPAAAAVAPAPVANQPDLPIANGEDVVIQRDPAGHFVTTATVNGQPVHVVVDTGATDIALTVADAQALGFSTDPSTFREIGTGASGPVRGMTVMLNDVDVGGKHVSQMPAAVLEGLPVSLLGQSYLRRIGDVRISADTMTLR